MRKFNLFNTDLLKKLPIGLLIVFGLIVGALYIFGLITHEIFLEEEDEFDRTVSQFIDQHLRSDTLTDIMKLITDLASAWVLQAGYGTLIIIYLIRKHWIRCLEIFSVGVGGYLLNFLLKLLFQRDRPADPLIGGHTNFAFPSGHASSAFIFYGLLIYLIFKASIAPLYKYSLIAVLLLLTLFIGFSRIYLRVHHATDVVAGFCIGFAWLLGCTWLFYRLRKQNQKRAGITSG